MKKILVLGASGYVDRVICFAAGLKYQLIQTHCNNKKSTKSVKVNFFIDDYPRELLDIDTVIFCAMVEDKESPDLEKRMTRFTDTFSNRRIIYISSDAVFSGKRGEYNESDIPDPNTGYGRNLFLCENIIRTQCTNHCIIRPSYLYGYSDGIIDKRLAETRIKLQGNREVKLFCDMYKSPLGVQQLANAATSMTASDFTGIIHIAGNRISVFEFYRQAMEALCLPADNLKPITIPIRSNMSKDTSLDILNWMRLAKTRPLSISETLSGSNVIR